MNIIKPVAVLSLAVVLGLSGAQFAAAHGHGGGGHGMGGGQGAGHMGGHGMGGGHTHGGIESHHHDFETPIYPDGNGGVYHHRDGQLRHCRPADGAEHSLSCTEWQ